MAHALALEAWGREERKNALAGAGAGAGTEMGGWCLWAGAAGVSKSQGEAPRDTDLSDWRPLIGLAGKDLAIWHHSAHRA